MSGGLELALKGGDLLLDLQFGAFELCEVGLIWDRTVVFVVDLVLKLVMTGFEPNQIKVLGHSRLRHKVSHGERGTPGDPSAKTGKSRLVDSI